MQKKVKQKKLKKPKDKTKIKISAGNFLELPAIFYYQEKPKNLPKYASHFSRFKLFKVKE